MGKKSGSMTRGDMVTIVANKTGLEKMSVEKVLDCFLNTIIAELSRDRSVKLSGFGTFENASYKPRKLSSPLTGETISLDERVIPKFKPSPSVRDKINKKVALQKESTA